MGFSLLSDSHPFCSFFTLVSTPSYSHYLHIFFDIYNPSLPWTPSNSRTCRFDQSTHIHNYYNFDGCLFIWVWNLVSCTNERMEAEKRRGSRVGCWEIPGHKNKKTPENFRVIKSRKIRWPGQVARMETQRNDTGIWWGNLQGKDNLEYFGANRRIASKWILQTYDRRVWTGFIWLTKGRSGRLLYTRYWNS